MFVLFDSSLAPIVNELPVITPDGIVMLIAPDSLTSASVIPDTTNVNFSPVFLETPSTVLIISSFVKAFVCEVFSP